jgi:DNA-binding HxlR family transcriptional regulator
MGHTLRVAPDELRGLGTATVSFTMYELDRPVSCSIGRAMEILGERWTFLILRESFYGVRRFSDMQRNLGIARNILSTRLQTLVANGILERRLYQDEPPRHEYRLTEAGRDLYPAIVTLMRWGDRHLSDEPPVVLRHNSCGHEADPLLVCSHCHEELDPHDVTPVRNDDFATA